MAKRQQDMAKHDPKIASAASQQGSGASVNVILKEGAKVGDGQMKKGDSLGSVQLADGVDLNYFVDAIRTGLAADEKQVKEAEEANAAASE